MRRDPHGASLKEIEDAYRRGLPQFRRVARAILGDAEQARDAVQDAFARSIERRHEFRGDGPLDAWLWRSVTRTALAYQRRAAVRSRLTVHASSGEAETNGQPAGGDERLRAAIAALPERQRLTLFLHYFADLDYDDIATVLGVAVGTVGASLTAARSSLRRALSETQTTAVSPSEGGTAR